MAQFALDRDADVLDVIEQLGSYLAGIFQAAEASVIRALAERVRRDLDVPDQAVRLGALTGLRRDVARILAQIDTKALADQVLAVAVSDGVASAVSQLQIGKTLGVQALRSAAGGALSVGITPTAAVAVASIGLDLQNSLDQVKSRILRTTPDLYQQTVARFAPRSILGTTTGRKNRAAAVTDFLAQGVTGFTDRSGRNWSIGGYTEMATRTATGRAWQAAQIDRFGQSGFDLVSPVEPPDCCKPCRRWAGKVLSTSGQTGEVVLDHATKFGETVTVRIDGTLDSARADGWGHPNERGVLAVVFPGLSRPKDEARFDPQQEKDRERLRLLERKVRAQKLRLEIAQGLGDDLGAATRKRNIRDLQAQIREHTAATGQTRRPYREQLAFQVGKPPKVAPLAITS